MVQLDPKSKSFKILWSYNYYILTKFAADWLLFVDAREIQQFFFSQGQITPDVLVRLDP